MPLMRIGNSVFDWEHLYAVHVEPGLKRESGKPILELFVDLPHEPEKGVPPDPKPFAIARGDEVRALWGRLKADSSFIVSNDDLSNDGWAVNAARVCEATFDPNGLTLDVVFWFGSVGEGRARHLTIGPDATSVFKALGNAP